MTADHHPALVAAVEALRPVLREVTSRYGQSYREPDYNPAAHLEKMAISGAIIRAWNAVPGHRAELWAWRKIKVKRGGKAVRWECEVTPLGADGGSR